MQFLHALVRRFKTGEIIPWRMRYRGGVWNTLVAVHFRRIWLSWKMHPIAAHPRNDVTFVIPVRNRVDYRICNALTSIRSQKYDRGDVYIIIVDYGSEPRAAAELEHISRKYRAKYVRVENQGPWSRSHSSNIGIKLAHTKYVVSTDIDIIFADNYICETVRALQENRLSVVYSQILDLPESCEKRLEAMASGEERLDIEYLRSQAKPIRLFGNDAVGTNSSYTFFYHLVRGYDEYYKCYGSEDDDLARRFFFLGLQPMSLTGRTYYLHQWHPQEFRIPDETYARVSDQNVSYLVNSRSILRNPRGWGNL